MRKSPIVIANQLNWLNSVTRSSATVEIIRDRVSNLKKFNAITCVTQFATASPHNLSNLLTIYGEHNVAANNIQILHVSAGCCVVCGVWCLVFVLVYVCGLAALDYEYVMRTWRAR